MLIGGWPTLPLRLRPVEKFRPDSPVRGMPRAPRAGHHVVARGPVSGMPSHRLGVEAPEAAHLPPDVPVCP